MDILYMLYTIGEELKKLPYIKSRFFNELDLKAPAPEGDVVCKPKSKITTQDFENALFHINQIKSTINELVDNILLNIRKHIMN